MFCTFCNNDFPDNRMKNHIIECPNCKEKALHNFSKDVSVCAVCGKEIKSKPLIEFHEPEVVSLPELETIEELKVPRT